MTVHYHLLKYEFVFTFRSIIDANTPFIAFTFHLQISYPFSLPKILTCLSATNSSLILSLFLSCSLHYLVLFLFTPCIYPCTPLLSLSLSLSLSSSLPQKSLCRALLPTLDPSMHHSVHVDVMTDGSCACLFVCLSVRLFCLYLWWSSVCSGRLIRRMRASFIRVCSCDVCSLYLLENI